MSASRTLADRKSSAIVSFPSNCCESLIIPECPVTPAPTVDIAMELVMDMAGELVIATFGEDRVIVSETM